MLVTLDGWMPPPPGEVAYVQRVYVFKLEKRTVRHRSASNQHNTSVYIMAR